jgi:hypothetical protein
VVAGGGNNSGPYQGNTASGNCSFVGGGVNNLASGVRSVVVGGGGYYGNIACGVESFVGGGSYNIASGTESFVGGGCNNRACGTESFVGGGLGNNITKSFLVPSIFGIDKVTCSLS